MTIYILIIILLLYIAMLCRSLVHTLLHHYPAFSIKWKIKNHQWWNPAVSWKNKYNADGTRNKKMVQFSDAFHTFNTTELGAYAIIIAILIPLWLGLMWYFGVGIFIITGVILMPLFFNLGYDRLWR